MSVFVEQMLLQHNFDSQCDACEPKNVVKMTLLAVFSNGPTKQ